MQYACCFLHAHRGTPTVVRPLERREYMLSSSTMTDVCCRLALQAPLYPIAETVKDGLCDVSTYDYIPRLKHAQNRCEAQIRATGQRDDRIFKRWRRFSSRGTVSSIRLTSWPCEKCFRPVDWKHALLAQLSRNNHQCTIINAQRWICRGVHSSGTLSVACTRRSSLPSAYEPRSSKHVPHWRGGGGLSTLLLCCASSIVVPSLCLGSGPARFWLSAWPPTHTIPFKNLLTYTNVGVWRFCGVLVAVMGMACDRHTQVTRACLNTSASSLYFIPAQWVVVLLCGAFISSAQCLSFSEGYVVVGFVSLSSWEVHYDFCND